MTGAVAVGEDTSIKAAVLQERLEGHEKVCSERYGEIKASFGRVHDRLDGINTGIRSVLIGMVVFLLGVIGFFVAPYFLKGG